MRAPLLLDCDPGLDDAVSIMALASADQLSFTVTDIVACGGNAALARTYSNAAMVTEHAALDAALHAGLPLPIADASDRPPRSHGDDGLGGLGRSGDVVPAVTGPAAITAFVRRHEGVATLLCTGPLTDLAAALEADRELAALIDRVVVMGGAFTDGAEFNWWANPDAADHVCRAGLPLEVVPLDVTGAVDFTIADADAIEAAGAPFAAALVRTRITLGKDASRSDRGAIHDVVAAAVLLHPELATFVTSPVSVVTTGRQRGHAALTGDGRPPVRVARHIDSAAAHDMIIDLLRHSR